MNKYPCQQLLGGRGSAIYMNEDGLCDHPECAEASKEQGDDPNTCNGVASFIVRGTGLKIECDLKHKCVRHKAYRQKSIEGRVNSRMCIDHNHKYFIERFDRKPNFQWEPNALKHLERRDEIPLGKPQQSILGKGILFD